MCFEVFFASPLGPRLGEKRFHDSAGVSMPRQVTYQAAYRKVQNAESKWTEYSNAIDVSSGWGHAGEDVAERTPEEGTIAGQLFREVH